MREGKREDAEKKRHKTFMRSILTLPPEPLSFATDSLVYKKGAGNDRMYGKSL